MKRHTRRNPLSRSAVDVLEALRSLGGKDVTTAQLVNKLAGHIGMVGLSRTLETLERNGRVTSSLTLDRLERLWSIDGKAEA